MGRTNIIKGDWLALTLALTMGLALALAACIPAGGTGPGETENAGSAPSFPSTAHGGEPPILVVSLDKRPLEEMQAELNLRHRQGYRVAGMSTSTIGGRVIVVLQRTEAGAGSQEYSSREPGNGETR